MRRILVLLALLVCACDGPVQGLPTLTEQASVPPTPTQPPTRPSEPPPVDIEPPFVFAPPPPGTFPVATSAGHTPIKAPKVVPIVFAGDPQRQVITDFTAKLATSSYWGTISSEYGVGPLTALAPIILSEAAPATIDDAEVASWLVAKLASDPATFGVPSSDTLYAIYYPPGTTVTLETEKSCETFGGYHYETSAAGTPIAYAVMPRCPALLGLGGSDVTTFAASHEVLEWATDPFPLSDLGYANVDDDHAVWARVFGGELADLCTQLGDVSIIPPDLGFTVQRTWSNASAAAGHHPCVPTVPTPYFTAFPTSPERISVTSDFGALSTRGFKVGVGQTKTVDLTLYSDAPTGSWTLEVIDITRLYGESEEFSYRLDKTRGRSGDTVHLTITGERAATSGQGFIVVSEMQGTTNMYPVWVTN